MENNFLLILFENVWENYIIFEILFILQQQHKISPSCQ